MRRVAVKIAYLGEGFSGSQIQPAATGLHTVAGEILDGLQLVDHVPADHIDLHFASRTDAGVSALGNVAVFYTAFINDELFLRALNSVSHGVYYTSIATVDDRFNPRLAAKRYYRYVVSTDRIDVSRFTSAAKLFQGYHNYRRFARTESMTKSTVMTIDSVDVRTEGGLIITDFCADYFLWNMIRRIMAAVIEVGLGMTDTDDVAETLAGKDATYGLAKPDGLTLLNVTYEGLTFVRPARCPYEKRLGRDRYQDALLTSFHNSL